MAWVARHSDLAKSNIAAVEWSFGADHGNQAPPYKIDSPSGPFYISGRVDRIDWEGGHVVVRDYKTNRSSIYAKGGRKPAEGRRPNWHYPMILYALVAGEFFKAEAEPVLEFVDPREGEDQLKIEPGDPSELSELWEDLLKGRMKTARNPELCGYCQFFRLCRPHTMAVLSDEEVGEE
jgi:RecB family exonuclease